MALNTSIRGLQIKDAFFGDGIKRNGADGDIAEVALKSSGGLKIDTGEIAVEPNDFAGAGLEDDGADNLKISDGGVTNDMLAGSIADGKLAQDYIQTSEVDGTTIEFDGGSLNVVDAGIDTTQLANDSVDKDKINADIAGDGLSQAVGGELDVNVDDSTLEIDTDTLRVKDEGITVAKLDINNAEQDGYVLTWNDAGYMEWTAKTSVGEAVIEESEIHQENESSNCDGLTTDFSLDNAPVVNSVQVYLNGLLQEEGSGKDYVLHGANNQTVSFATAPETGDILIIHYIAT